MSQKEEANEYNFGADNYYDSCNKNNFYYDEKDYHLNRTKPINSIIVKDNDTDKVVDIILDIGLSHHQHGVTQDLSSDRLFLNKIDPHRMRFDDFRNSNLVAKHDNLTSVDWANRINRIGKLVDRDDFHEQLGYIEDANYFHNSERPYWFYKYKRRR